MSEERASARPERLLNLAETAQAIKEALQTRAGYLEDAWEAYHPTNGADWRVDFGDLPGAVRGWAQTLGTIGEWTGGVGQAFLDADANNPGGVHSLRESRLESLMSRADRRILEESDADTYIDWGDPDDPPPWLEALRLTGVALGHAGEGADAMEVAFVVGAGEGARWSQATPTLLGRFASASALSKFGNVLGTGSAALGGLAAGLSQWLADSSSLNYGEEEAAGRSVVRGAGTAAAIAGGGYVGATYMAPALCVPGALACATVVIVGTGLLATDLGDRLVNLVLDEPQPAEHDPDLVHDEILGLEPGYLPRDVADPTWDVLQDVVDTADAVQPGLAERHPYLEWGWSEFDAAAADELDLPLPWIAEHYGDQAAIWAQAWEESSRPASDMPMDPETLAAIDQYEEGLRP